MAVTAVMADSTELEKIETDHRLEGSQKSR